MPFLRLVDLRSGSVHEFRSAEVRIGRDPKLDLTLTGEGADVVSGNHLRFVYKVRRWWVEDFASRNGTYVAERRLAPGASEVVKPGMVLRLGLTGPQLKVEAAASQTLDATVAEPTPVPAGAEALSAATPGEVPTFSLVLRDLRSGTTFEAGGSLIRLGRAADCEIRPLGADDQLISRVHAEVFSSEDGKVYVRDAGGPNGTFLNGRPLEHEHELKLKDQIKLGEEGPVLFVERLSLPGRATKDRGGWRGLFGRPLVAEISQKGASRLRHAVWAILLILVAAVAGLFLIIEKRDEDAANVLEQQRSLLEERRRMLDAQRDALAAQQATIDSVVVWIAEARERLRDELSAARDAAAPAAMLDSLGNVLDGAEAQAAALTILRARVLATLRRQFAAGNSARRDADAEVERLAAELTNLERKAAAEMRDSLQRSLRTAELRAAEIDGQLRALSGINLAALALANQRAVGRVTAFQGSEQTEGSGFVITASGYFVTSRGVAQPGQMVADSLFVTIAGGRVRAAVALASPDLAILRLRDHRGPHIEKIDWSGTGAVQGAAVALIGFSAAADPGLEDSGSADTSMSAGTLSVTSEGIQLNGFAIAGSRGSPILNAAGEVVAVHGASLRHPGSAVPIKELIPLLPAKVKSELEIN